MITSLEIANLLNKRHGNVKRAILRHGIKHDTQYYYRENNLGFKVKNELFVVDDDVISLFKLKGVALQRCQELIALTTIEQLQGVKLIRQYSVLGKYHIDGYDPVNNIAYEIDEKYHFTPQQMEADRIREREIKAALGCEFVRIHV
ncbi:hypothetical protein ACVV2V_002664 [Escherichia coli]|nr:hypothetical protein [Escherichia coli]HCB7960139.1 hypothetical protein [Escherichia coli]